MIDENKEEEYNVKQNCYGCTQKERGTALIEGYWNRNLWNPAFNQTMKTYHQGSILLANVKRQWKEVDL